MKPASSRRLIWLSSTRRAMGPEDAWGTEACEGLLGTCMDLGIVGVPFNVLYGRLTMFGDVGVGKSLCRSLSRRSRIFERA